MGGPKSAAWLMNTEHEFHDYEYISLKSMGGKV